MIINPDTVSIPQVKHGSKFRSKIVSNLTRKHWNTSNITPKDPVALNLCTQSDLQKAVEKANRKVENLKKAKLKLEANK